MRNILTVIICLTTLSASAQIFNYDAEGLSPLNVCVDIPGTNQGRISEGIISFLNDRYSEPEKVLKNYRKLPDREEFLLIWDTGAKYLNMGVFEATGNVSIAVLITAMNDKYKLDIKSVFFEQSGDDISNALQKNSIFFTHTGKARFDTKHGNAKEVHLNVYFDMLTGTITEFINREKHKER